MKFVVLYNFSFILFWFFFFKFMIKEKQFRWNETNGKWLQIQRERQLQRTNDVHTLIRCWMNFHGFSVRNGRKITVLCVWGKVTLRRSLNRLRHRSHAHFTNKTKGEQEGKKEKKIFNIKRTETMSECVCEWLNCDCICMYWIRCVRTIALFFYSTILFLWNHRKYESAQILLNEKRRQFESCLFFFFRRFWFEYNFLECRIKMSCENVWNKSRKIGKRIFFFSFIYSIRWDVWE